MNPLQARIASRWCLIVGGLGIAVCSMFYAFAPASAAMPTAAENWPGAFDATITDGHLLPFLALIGIPADSLIIAGALLRVWLGRAQSDDGGRSIAGAVGWLLVALACLLFVLVDALGGIVLPRIASTVPHDYEAWVPYRSIYDGAFTAAVVTFILGMAGLAWGLTLTDFLRGAMSCGTAIGFVGVAFSFTGTPWSGLVMGTATVTGCVVIALQMLVEHYAPPLTPADELLHQS